jgi:hypothetical protein
VLTNNILYRGVATKVSGTDPVTATSGNLYPYVENVMNNASSAQMADLKASNPTMFPTNNPVPIFQYTYAAGTTSQPSNIREVNITLIVQSPQRDPRTRQLRAVTLTGLVRTLNPDQ